MAYLSRETITTSSTIDPGATLHFIDASGGAVDVTLLDASSSADHILFRIDTSSNAVNILTPSSQTLNGKTPPVPMLPFQTVDLLADNDASRWLSKDNYPMLRGAPFIYGTIALTPSATQYLRVGSGATSATILNFRFGVHTLVHKLYVTAGTGPTGASDVFTVFKNGSATSLTATLAASSTTASDTTHFIIFYPGDSLALQCNASAVPSAEVMVSLTMT